MADITIKVGEKNYTLNAGSGALRRMEGVFSTPDRPVTFQEVIRQSQRGSYRHTIAILWSMLKKHHPEMTMDDVDDLVDSVGMEAVNQKFEGLLREMVPDPKDLAALGIKPNPQEAQAKAPAAPSRKRGTGARSTSKPVALA